MWVFWDDFFYLGDLFFDRLVEIVEVVCFLWYIGFVGVDLVVDKLWIDMIVIFCWFDLGECDVGLLDSLLVDIVLLVGDINFMYWEVFWYWIGKFIGWIGVYENKFD